MIFFNLFNNNTTIIIATKVVNKSTNNNNFGTVTNNLDLHLVRKNDIITPSLSLYTSTENSMESIRVRFMGVLAFILVILFLLYKDLIILLDFNKIELMYYINSNALTFVSQYSDMLLFFNLLINVNKLKIVNFFLVKLIYILIKILIKILLFIKFLLKFICFILFMFLYIFFNIHILNLYYLVNFLIFLCFISGLVNHIIASLNHMRNYSELTVFNKVFINKWLFLKKALINLRNRLINKKFNG